MLGKRPIGTAPIAALPSTVTGFDPAYMAAMNRPWRDAVVVDQPSVVASGMAPPDDVIP